VKITYRNTSASPGSPLSVELKNSVRSSSRSSGNGNSGISFQLPPIWDLEKRANAEEVFLAVLSRAARAAHGRDIDPGDGSYRLIENRPEAEEWVRSRIGRAVIAIDIEGDKNPDKVHPSLHTILCLGLCDGRETVIFPEELFSSLWEEMGRLLEEATCVAHHGKFDATVLGWRLRGRNEPIQLAHDTMLAHYALWPAGGDDADHENSRVAARAYHGLKLLGDLYLGCGEWSLSTAEYHDMRSVSLPDLYTYNAKDVQRTHLLMKIFRDQFSRNPDAVRTYMNILMPASNHLAWQEGTGVCVDVDYVRAELVPDMTEEVNRLTVDMIKQVNELLPDHPWTMVARAKRLPGEGSEQARRFNPGSADQVRVVLASQGIVLPVDRTSKTGKGSTSQRTLNMLLREKMKGNPFLTTLLRRRATEKLLTTYARPLAERAHTEHPFSGLRVFPHFHLHKTLSGRLASSGPNIQNQPKSKAIKRAYVPSGPERCVCQADYGQAELRVMAVLGKDDYLRSFFKRSSEFNKNLKPGEKKMDLFNDMMPSVFPNVDFLAHPEKKEELRRPLKATVYGVSYALGAHSLAEDLDVPLEYAQKLIDDFLATVPGVTAWRQDVIDQVLHNTPLVTRFGRHLLHEMITDKNREDIIRRALSFLPQSSASDCCLLAAIELGKFIRKEGLDWDITALIHDAIYLDVPEDEARDAVRITGEFMTASASEWFPEVPFDVDGSYGRSWAEI
jgi:DNA polymerase-1